MRMVSAKSMIIALALLIAVSLGEASGCTTAPSQTSTTTAVDPVCGTTVQMEGAEEAGLTSVWKDKTCYFCEPICQEKFEQMPMMYFDKCAVCGGLVQRAGAVNSVHMGNTFYFCTGTCKETFDKEPEAYFAKLATDPVCGMTVDTAKAEVAGLTSSSQGVNYYFCNPGCKTKFERESTKYIVGDETAVDPVCKMTVVKKDAETQSLTSVYQGDTYYFCCSDCKHYFERKPEKYLK
ncbi:YHS domain-containing protein [Chloroflexota bacterium]